MLSGYQGQSLHHAKKFAGVFIAVSCTRYTSHFCFLAPCRSVAAFAIGGWISVNAY